MFQRSSCAGWSERRERVEEDNILLYVGLGMSAVGLAVTFVGRKQGARKQGAREAAECGVMISLTLGTRNHYNHHSY